MYDNSNSGLPFRKYTSLSLAWWHSYKWASKQLFKATTIIYSPHKRFMLINCR